MFNIFGYSACWRPSRMRIAFNRFPPTFEALLPPFYLGFTHLIIPESLLNRSNNFRGWTSKCAAKLDADSLITHSVIVKCDGHTALKLSQGRLTAEWLAPPEGNCSRMCSKVSSDWLHDRFSRYSKWLCTCLTDLMYIGFSQLLYAYHSSSAYSWNMVTVM